MKYELVLADCHEWIRTIPDGSISAVISDPPYHVTQLKFDALEVRWAELWPEIYRVCKPSAVQVMFSAQPFTTDLIVSNRKRFRYEVIWEKPTPSDVLNANFKPLKVHENILVFGEKPANSTYIPQMWQGRPKGVIRRSALKSEHHSTKSGSVYVNNGERHPVSVIAAGQGHGGVKPLHPTQKPLELLAYLVKTYTNPGDTVLDLFAGSGTTLAACLHLGRNALGCEIDENYHALAKRRLDAIAAQPALAFS